MDLIVIQIENAVFGTELGVVTTQGNWRLRALTKQALEETAATRQSKLSFLALARKSAAKLGRGVS